jgi:putative membrane protein
MPQNTSEPNPHPPPLAAQRTEILCGDPAFELASRQASLAFERTIVTIDQGLMSAVRTSLSLIGFGFAAVLFFHQAGAETGIDLKVPARNFGLSLVAMGIMLVSLGLIEHRSRLNKLKRQTAELHQRRLLLEHSPRRHAPVAYVAIILLISGILVIVGTLGRIGPFS